MKIGRGGRSVQPQGLRGRIAYTADGGTLGGGVRELQRRCCQGGVPRRNIHPGSAKNQMVNSQLIAMEFHSLLPRPPAARSYRGLWRASPLLTDMKGTVELSQLRYIIRDHDMGKFTRMKELFGKSPPSSTGNMGEGTVELTLKDSYYNMKERILPVMHIIDRAKTAMERVGITPVTVPVRGGTDGARLSYEGLPCPNLCTGGENYHGRFGTSRRGHGAVHPNAEWSCSVCRPPMQSDRGGLNRPDLPPPYVRLSHN